jgi:hypothetical protein
MKADPGKLLVHESQDAVVTTLAALCRRLEQGDRQ